jgi:ATP-binding cassette, subfamily C, bacteriocin exporter
VLQKFYPFENGNIEVDTTKWENISIPEWRQSLGVVPQEIAVFSGTLLANICLDDSPHHAQQIVAFCKEYGFDTYFEAFPQGYTTILGEGGVALSGGQKQLLGIARCLYHQPKVLLLDEPTSAMDSKTEEFVTGLLERIKSNTITILISHKDSLTKIADRIYLLQAGITTPFSQKKSRQAEPVTTEQAIT